MIDSKKLLTDLESKKTSRATMVKRLEDDLRKRCDADPAVDAPLKARYDEAKEKKRTAFPYKVWREDELTQIAVAWVLGCVFVRFLEDNELVETPKLSGVGARLQRARDEHEVFFRRQPADNTDRGYLIEVFEEVGKLPGMREFFDKKHNPLWLAAPSGDACRELLQFWQKTDPASGDLLHDFSDPDWNTRFLGDLYQDLSEAARKKYALLQTPDFVEEFILDRTLTPAIDTFGYREVRLIDPTCGSGHFLLGTFARLFRIWQDECPGENPRVLAQRALDGVYGVDLNPFAVAIARFRLLLAALQVCGEKRLKDSPDFRIHLAVGDSLLHGARFRKFEGTATEMTFDTEEIFKDELAHFFDTEDSAELHRILGQQYHAVVGNPPYITVKDKALNLLYRGRFDSCHRKYALSVPFMERIFDLALSGSGDGREPSGFTGQITANSFMKKEFGKKLIEDFIPNWDLTHIIDTSGAYIPDHGTPTVILFGRNTKPISSSIRTVSRINGEPGIPDDPAFGKVWSAVIDQIDRPGSVGEFLSVDDVARAGFYEHPWNIGGGGIADLKNRITENSKEILNSSVESVGFSSILAEDEAFKYPQYSWRLAELHAGNRRSYVIGEDVRDWDISINATVLFPYSEKIELTDKSEVLDFLWNWRTGLWNRPDFSGQTYKMRGRTFWEYHQIPPDRNQRTQNITFANVATLGHFVYVRELLLYNAHAPLITLPEAASPNDHLHLVGLLNSSIACFWMKQMFSPKGGSGIGRGIQSEKWEERYELDGTKLRQFPIPVGSALILAKEIDREAQEMSKLSPDSLSDIDAVSVAELDTAEQQASAIRARMISLQEELDWQCYRHYGLIEASDNLEWPEDRLDDLPPLTLGERAFEIHMARQMAAGELESTWFERHKDAGSKPITGLAGHWPDDYRALVERRLAFIEANKNINLIERPEYKRRWNTEPWAKRQKEALRKWLLARLEGYFHEGSRVCDLGGSFDPAANGFTAATRPHLATANQLADAVQSDGKFLEAAEVYEGASGFSVPKLIRSLIESESVPYLPRDRYKDSGLRKREVWEETWELQRQEDAVEGEVRGQGAGGSEEELKKRIRKAQLERVGEIPVPPKYTSKDFLKTTYWKHRGKLDVPKERWISYPGAERAGDDSLLIAWAGWDHLQQAQALAEYFIDARDNQAFPPDRLKPLLAGLSDLLPWLLQWHNKHDPDYGMGLGDYFASFVEENCRMLGMTLKEVDEARFDTEAVIQAPKAGAKTLKVRKSKKTEDEVSAGNWQDAAFVLLAPQRIPLSDYRRVVWPELLRQFPGDLPFETFLKAYWLLAEPETLAARGREMLPDVPAGWWGSRPETLVKTEFLDTLKGSVQMGWVKIWKEDGERMIRWNGEAPSHYPEAIDDARVALQIAELWEDEVPETEQKKIEAELVEMGF